jgi:hypothetical protein
MPKETGKKLLNKIASGWGTIISFGIVLVIGGSSIMYMYNTFPTTQHIVGRFAQKSEVVAIDDKVDTKLREFEKKVNDDIKAFKRRYRKDRIIAQSAQLDVIKHSLAKDSGNPELVKYKCILEAQILDLLEKMDKED